MAQSNIPPPPNLALSDPMLNRWLIELTNILNGQGTIGGVSVLGFSQLQAAVAAQTVEIAGLNNQISQLQSQVAGLQQQAQGFSSEIAQLIANGVLSNGTTPPASGQGNVNDWYADTSAKHIYVKTAVATWTQIV